MQDPVERMVRFVLAQKEQAALEHARSEWARRLPLLVPRVRQVLAVFHGALEGAPEASLHLDVRLDRRPLVVTFADRSLQEEGILSMHTERPGRETGASTVFRCETDGIVYGFRYPFHATPRDVRPERYADLGEPSAVQPDALAHAVADFLEWAAAGPGSGVRRMRFWAPSAAPDEPATLRLAS